VPRVFRHPYPVVRLRAGAFSIDVADGTTAFDDESSFIMRSMWA
jgi:hypothetical protein